MFFGAGGNEVDVPLRRLRVFGVWPRKPASVFRWGGSWRGDGRVERVGFEGWGLGMGGDGCGGGVEGVAGDEDVVVGGAAAFGGDDVGVVGGCDFVDDADHVFVPVGV